jgi:putative PIN family toxin of toxin-antitoxin system
MMTERSVVFDTNVIISALLIKQSVARQAFDKALQQGKLLLSLTTLEELNNVLKRKKFDKYIHENERLLFLATLVDKATLIEVNEIVTECRDPKDNKFLELAVSGNAICIVSGDKDLLALHPFRGIPIMTPAVFLRFYE